MLKCPTLDKKTTAGQPSYLHRLYMAIRHDHILMSSFDSLRFWFSGGRKEHVLELYDLVRPLTFLGLKKIRIGNKKADGGYVMANDFCGIDGALSLGIGHDVSWDAEMCEYDMEIYQFDHTVDAPEANKGNSKLHFHQVGIAGSSDPSAKMKSIKDILSDEMSLHTNDLILKIDIDGYEWDVFDKMPADVLSRFRQICIEIHTPLGRHGQSAIRERNLRVLRKLYSHFAPVHLHANNASPSRIYSGLEVPKLLEITYVRRNGQNFTDSQENFPGELDIPNVPSHPEINIGTIVARKKSQ